MKHKRLARISAICITTLFLLLIASFSAAQEPARLICDIWPPYQIEENGTVNGFSTELVQAVYRNMEVPIAEIKAYPWKRAMNILEHGHAEALFSANQTEERKIFARYPAEMLFEAPWIIWTRGKTKLHSLEDLKGKRVGVVLGYSYTDEFWEFIETYCTVEKVSTDETNFRKLKIGRLDAVVAEYGNGQYLTAKFGWESIKPRRSIEIKKDGLYIMFNRINVSQSFVDEFSRQLKLFKGTDQYKDLRIKYFGNE